MNATHKCKQFYNKYVRLQGRLYIHTCRSYVHSNGTSLARLVASVLIDKQNIALSLVSLGLQARLGSYSCDFGLLGEQSSPK